MLGWSDDAQEQGCNAAVLCLFKSGKPQRSTVCSSLRSLWSILTQRPLRGGLGGCWEFSFRRFQHRSALLYCGFGRSRSMAFLRLIDFRSFRPLTMLASHRLKLRPKTAEIDQTWPIPVQASRGRAPAIIRALKQNTHGPSTSHSKRDPETRDRPNHTPVVARLSVVDCGERSRVQAYYVDCCK